MVKSGYLGIYALISFEGLNGFQTNALTFDCVSKKGFLGSNLAVGVCVYGTDLYVQNLTRKFFGEVWAPL